jgi:hypothetical protein
MYQGAPKGTVRGHVDTYLADEYVLTKTPRIPTKSYACMSMLRSQGSVFTAKSCKGAERVPYALKWGPVSYGRKP